MKAILSDIHGNLEALHAVLDDIARHPVDAVYCLGDLVGYGPNPRECVDLAMWWRVVLRGNFDAAILADPPDLGPTAISANRSLAWSRAELNAPIPGRKAVARRWALLSGSAPLHTEGDWLFVHGSPRGPLNEYVFPEDIYNPRKMEQVFAAVERHCFHGHTHVPGILTEDLQFHIPSEINSTYRLGGCKALCNVGSVGQPRDGDWRACYVLLSEGAVHFRRVEYDIETTVRKIRDIDDLDDFLGDRLPEGR